MLSDEEAKALQEVAKLGGKALDKASGRAIRAVLGPIAEHWLGQAALMRAKYEMIEAGYRLENLAAFAKRLEEKSTMLSIDLSSGRAVPPRIALDYRDGIETEDEPSLRELWVNLLINTTRHDGPEPQKVFKEILHEMEGDDILLFQSHARHSFQILMAPQGPHANDADTTVVKLAHGQYVHTLANDGYFEMEPVPMKHPPLLIRRPIQKVSVTFDRLARLRIFDQSADYYEIYHTLFTLANAVKEALSGAPDAIYATDRNYMMSRIEGIAGMTPMYGISALGRAFYEAVKEPESVTP